MDMKNLKVGQYLEITTSTKLGEEVINIINIAKLERKKDGALFFKPVMAKIYDDKWTIENTSFAYSMKFIEENNIQINPIVTEGRLGSLKDINNKRVKPNTTIRLGNLICNYIKTHKGLHEFNDLSGTKYYYYTNAMLKEDNLTCIEL